MTPQSRTIYRYTFLVSSVMLGVVTVFVLRHVFELTLVTSVIGGILVGLAEWMLYAFVFRRLGGGRLSDFDDAG